MGSLSGAAPTVKLTVRDCTKRFSGRTVLDHIGFQVRSGEFLSVLGPSGCGKTTLLRILAGLETPDGGTVELDGADITALPPARRRMGFVFQDYALFENMTVLKNVSYGLRFHPEFRGREDRRACELLERLGLAELQDSLPARLSGGQRQRVALARTLALNPDVILFDEPMAALDADTRLMLQDELGQLRREFSSTFLYVTHDQEEAFSMSDRIMVMSDGRIHQLDAPEELLRHPADEYVRQFVGENLLRRFRRLRRFAELAGEP